MPITGNRSRWNALNKRGKYARRILSAEIKIHVRSDGIGGIAAVVKSRISVMFSATQKEKRKASNFDIRLSWKELSFRYVAREINGKAVVSLLVKVRASLLSTVLKFRRLG